MTAPAATRPAGRRSDAAARREHLQALTGLRFVAALAVYGSHLTPPADAPVWLRTLQQAGYVGVTFFFVLSGFVLALNYFDQLRTPQQVWSYLAARIARVYPLYLTVLAWVAVTAWAAGELRPRVLVLHATGLQAWHPDLDTVYALAAPAWSISVELFLYATLPVLLPLVRLLDRRVWATVAGLLALVGSLLAVAWLFQHTGRGDLPWTDPDSAHRWLYRTPLTRVADFLIGVLAARLYLRARRSAAAARWGTSLTLAAAIVTVFLAAQPRFLNSTWSWDALYAAPAAALVAGLALAPQQAIARALSLRPVVLLGEASFAFYLLHATVLHLVDAGGWASGVTLPGVVVEAMNLGVALTMAIGLHVAVEKPARPVVRRWLDPAASRRRPVHHASSPIPAKSTSAPATVAMAMVPAPRPTSVPVPRPALRRPVTQGTSRAATTTATAHPATALRQYQRPAHPDPNWVAPLPTGHPVRMGLQ